MFVLVVAVVGPAGTVPAGISFNVALFFSLTTFVVDDFSPFVVHRMSHSIPILWELHKVLLQAAPPISVLHRQSIPKTGTRKTRVYNSQTAKSSRLLPSGVYAQYPAKKAGWPRHQNLKEGRGVLLGGTGDSEWIVGVA